MTFLLEKGYGPHPDAPVEPGVPAGSARGGRRFRGPDRAREQVSPSTPLALAAGNGGAAVVGVVLPGRFDDAARIAVVRRYPGCPAGVRALALSLVMLGLIDSATLAPLAFVGAVLPGAGLGVRAGLVVVTAGGVAAAAVIVACHACQAAAGLSALGAAAG